jgi:hypothetical protein
VTLQRPSPGTRICAALALLALAGCIPVQSDYYEPEAPGGRLIHGHCPPVDELLLVELDTAVLIVRARKLAERQVSVYLGFEIPEGRTVTLMDHHIEALDSAGGAHSSGELQGRIWTGVGRTGPFDPGTPMVGQAPRGIDRDRGAGDRAFRARTAAAGHQRPRIAAAGGHVYPHHRVARADPELLSLGSRKWDPGPSQPE